MTVRLHESPNRTRGTFASLVVAAWVAAAMASCALPAPALAQALRVVHPAPDCNLAERKYDGWLMRRYEWHAFNATNSLVLSEAMHRTTRLPRWASALTATLALGLVPHLISGLALKRYPINPMDWTFDLFNASAPLLMTLGLAGHPWIAASTELSGYAGLCCYASP